MALTKSQREEIEDEIYALRNDINISETEMNQYDDGEILVDGAGNAWRHSHDDYLKAISEKWEVVSSLQDRLISG